MSCRGHHATLRSTLLGAIMSLACLSSPELGRAQLSESIGQVAFPRTQVRTLRARANGIVYRLQLSLPRSFDETNQPYPVVYLLDADYSFAIARNIVEHLVDRGDLPELVLVGVGYEGSTTRDDYRLHRSRDYTPWPSPGDGYGPRFEARAGGAPQFFEFLSQELIPAIEAEFRTSDERVLVGHSYGGLFSTWVLMEHPGWFSAHVLVSPSLWYREQRALDLAAEMAARAEPLEVSIYAMVGDAEINSRHDMVNDLRRFGSILRPLDPQSTRLRVDVGDDETHNSVFPRALSNGLRMIWPRRR